MKRKASFVLIVVLLLNLTTGINLKDVEAGVVFNTKRTINNLVVFIDFNDTNSFNGSVLNSSNVENTYNDFLDSNNDNVSDIDKISLKSYIYDISRGGLIVNSTFYPKSKNENAYVSYKAPQNKAYYEEKTMGSEYEETLIRDAFNSIKNEVNLSGEELDSDNDGKIDSVTFIFSGLPALGGSSMLRPHKAELSKNRPVINGKEMSKYNILGEGSTAVNIYNKNMLGTIAHEYLHMIGYPDLYRNGSRAKLVDKWDLMGESKITPQLPLVYSRNTYGNSDLKVKEITESGVYTLDSSSFTNSDGIVAYKVRSKLYPNEYFMIEYRKNDMKWESKIPGSGIIVYRINESVPANYGNDSNRGIHVYVFRPGDTSVNSGNGNIDEAFLSSEAKRTTLGTFSNNPYEFNSNNIYFSDGVNSNIVISEVGTSSSEKITFKIDLPNDMDILGDGSIKNPYQIDSSDDFIVMARNLDKHFILTKDIDLSNINLSVIGDIDTPFSGSIDGKGYTVKNLTINSNEDEVGFIGYLAERGVIKNINFENVNIRSNGYCTGAIVGVSNGSIDNIKVSGKIESSSQLTIGGIVGRNEFEAKLTNSMADVEVISTFQGNTLVGGLIGDGYDSLVKNNYVKGKIEANIINRVGAVFGRNIIDDNNTIGDSVDNVWNITDSGIKNGVSEIIMPQYGETDKGLIGVELVKNISIEKGSSLESIVKYTKPLSSVSNHKILSNDTSIVSVVDNTIYGVGRGETSLRYELTLGTNKVIEDIKVEVIELTNEKPIITGVNDIIINKGQEFNPILNVTATDIEDGDLTKKITISGVVDVNKPGDYKLIYEVIDSDGNITSVERIITVEYEKEDVNKDGLVDILDLSMISSAYNTTEGTEGWNLVLDINKDEIIDLFDLVLVSKKIYLN